MYEHINKEPKPKRDRMILVALLIVAVLIGALIPPVYIAMGASYSYHNFVLEFSQSLTAAREEGVITRTDEEGNRSKVSADAVSSAFLNLTSYSFGQPLKKAPTDVSPFTVSLPDGTTLSFYDTPSDNGLEQPTGVTVQFIPAEGKPLIYLQRYVLYEDLVRPLKR
jgi:hypothetical protein